VQQLQLAIARVRQKPDVLLGSRYLAESDSSEHGCMRSPIFQPRATDLPSELCATMLEQTDLLVLLVNLQLNVLHLGLDAHWAHVRGPSQAFGRPTGQIHAGKATSDANDLQRPRRE
jgi:hypothetical protein